MRRSLLVAAVVLTAWCAAFAADDDEREPPEDLRELLQRLDRGEPIGPEGLRALERFAPRHLVRARCNALEDARFSIAQLQVKAGRGEDAVKTLKALAEKTKNPHVRSAALYNIGRVYRVVLGDWQKAADAFANVSGRFSSLARRDLVRMLTEVGKPLKAIEFLQAAVAKADDKGEKLALLRQLAGLCKRADRLDDAIATYRRITEEFTEKDIKGLAEAAAKRVRDTFKKVLRLHKEDRHEQAEQVMWELRGWMGRLAADNRLDELRAAGRELDKCHREAEKREREEEEAERREDEHEGEDEDEEDKGIREKALRNDDH